MTEIYADGGYLKNNPAWHAEDSPWKASQILRMLKRNDLQPATVCEVGCGAGEILRLLTEAMPGTTQFCGYDISPQAFELASHKVNSQLRFFLGDMLAADTPQFDVVAAIDVFEHVEDVFGFLRRLRSKGEYKLFHIPLDLSAQSVLRGSGLMRARDVAGHLHYFTKDTALATLRDSGYTIVDWFYTHSGSDRPGKGAGAMLLRWPRRLCFSVQPDFTARLLGGFSLMVLAR